MIGQQKTENLVLIGDGQLARYLAASAQKLGLRTYLLGRPESPASRFADHIVESLSDLALNPEATVVTFENEFLDVERIGRELERHAWPCFPELKTIEVLRDKRRQKQCLDELKISTPRYMDWQSQSVDSFLLQVTRKFPKDAVLKWSTGGYDSKGVFFFGPGVSMGDAAAFCERAREQGHAVFAEEKIFFEREVALVAARDAKGYFRYLPLVETWQDQGICRLVRSCPLAPELVAEARGVSEAIMSYWDYVGVLAVEFFVTPNSGLFVNEIAPRVHNSGHFSMLASECSQFDLHVAAVCAKSLPPNKHADHFAMWNILGPSWAERSLLREKPSPEVWIDDGVKLYWYEKELAEARRKMGHLCAVADSAEELEEKINVMMRWEEQFWEKNRP